MADEAARPVSTGLDDILADEQTKLDEEERRLRAGEKPSESPVPGLDLPTETEAAAPPSPAETAAPPPPEPAPAEKPPQQSGEGWKQARINERKAREAEERAAHFERLAREYEGKMRGEKPAEAAVPDFNTDPASNLLHRAETAEQRMARIEAESQQTRAMLAQQQELQTVRAQEEAFQREHPDYPQAVQHLINSELEEFRMGPKQATVARLNQAMMSGDQQIKQAVDQLAAAGLDEDSAIGTIAEQTYINGRAAQLREAARVMNKPVPELGYAFAQRRGWQSTTPQTAAGSTPPPQTPAQAEAALARVRQAQQISRGSQTLSEMDTTAPRQERRPTRAEVLAMRDEDIDAMFDQDPTNVWYKGEG
jgi:hypothetical protein